MQDNTTGYWSIDLDDIIVKYNASIDDEEREHLYRNYLDKPMRQMVECVTAQHLIRQVNFEEMRESVLHHVVLALSKYDKRLGKSYSYFTTVAKHFVWNFNTKYYVDRNKYTSIQGLEYIRAVLVEDFYNEQRADDPQIERRPKFPEALTTYQSIFADEDKFHSPLIDYVFTTDTCGGKKKRDIEIVNAIRLLFKDADNHTKFTKKAMFEKIRNTTGYKTEHIYRTLSRIKRNYEASL